MFFNSSVLVIILLIFNFILSHCSKFYDIDIEGDSVNGYFITTFVGTPPQKINLLVDTGSSNLAIASISDKRGTSEYFAYNESLTFVPSNTHVHIRYIQGDWSGFIGLDIFNLCFEKQDCAVTCNISCMTSINNIFDSDFQFQGILGLAYSSIAKPDYSIRPFLDIFTEVKHTADIFSLHLCGPYFSSNTTNTSCGKLQIGHSNGYDVQDIRFTPITQEWFYEITLTDIKVGQSSVPVKCNEINKNRTIVDSGTSELNVPPKIYNWIIEKIKEHVQSVLLDKFWVNETTYCFHNETHVPTSYFPNITLDLYHDKNTFFKMHISPELYVLPVTNITDSCVKLGIGLSGQGVIIGSTILKGFFISFDRENKRIGFAKPKNHPTSGFISDVSNILFNVSADFDQCIRQDDIPNDSKISPIVILALIGICLVAILFLYALLSWIWKFHVLGRDNVSDTSSLVDSDPDE